MRTLGQPLEDALSDIVRRIVQVANPSRIILFGSAARGTMGPQSDVDLLVVTRGPAHRRKLAGDIYMNLGGAVFPLDIIVVTPEDVERYANSPSLVIAPALLDGRVVYDAGTA